MLSENIINPRPNVRIVRETASTATVDGDNGLGKRKKIQPILVM
jgi:LDH2 family malate/lactate/ureidoglycolate dehydrogenase